MRNLISMLYGNVLSAKRTGFIQFSCLLIFASCASKDPETRTADTCYEGIVIGDKTNACNFVV